MDQEGNNQGLSSPVLMEQHEPPIPQPAQSDDISHMLPPSAIPSNAEDADLIEKPWVLAVKRVIGLNRNDPYSQSKAMTLLRKDYMKKRYGETIKNAK